MLICNDLHNKKYENIRKYDSQKVYIAKKHISKFSNKTFEYPRENEFLRETILTCLSGAQMGWMNELKKG